MIIAFYSDFILKLDVTCLVPHAIISPVLKVRIVGPFSSIASDRPLNRETAFARQGFDMTQFTAKVAAALDKRKLSDTDMGLMEEYANETRFQYCAGCTQI